MYKSSKFDLKVLKHDGCNMQISSNIQLKKYQKQQKNNVFIINANTIMLVRKATSANYSV